MTAERFLLHYDVSLAVEMLHCNIDFATATATVCAAH
jgi:hypothetical protein